MERKRGGGATGSLDQYLAEIGRRALLGPEEERALARRARLGDRRALEALVKANLRFVVAVARRYRGRGLPFEDLINEGNLGLLSAAERFDERRGVRFITYAGWWVRQAIFRALEGLSGPVAVPRPRGGRPGAGARGIPVARSLEDRGAEDGGAPLLELLPDPRVPAPDSEAERRGLRDALDASLAGLPRREERALRLYFGLDGGSPRTLAQVAERLGVSRERARQIKERALKRIRRGGTSERLRSYLR